MALRLPDFSYPQPQPSPIMQAFQIALDRLAQVPFEKAAENRAEERSTREAYRQQGLAIDTFRQQQTLARDMSEQADLQENYVERSPEFDFQLSQAAIDPNTVYRTYNAKQYIPKSVLAQASQLNAPIAAPQANMLDSVIQHLQQRGFAKDLKSGAPYTQRTYGETLQILQPTIEVAGLEESEAMRRAELALRAGQQDDQTQARLYGLLQFSQPNKNAGKGAYVLDEAGNPTSEVRPLSNDERFAYDNPALDIIEGDPNAVKNPAVSRYLAIRNDLRKRGVVDIQGLSDRYLQEETNRLLHLATDESSEMAALGDQAIRYGLPEVAHQLYPDEPYKKLSSRVEGAAFLATHPQALQAMVAAPVFGKTGIGGVENSQTLPGAARFDPPTIEFMKRIFAAWNLPSNQTTLPPVTGTSPAVGSTPSHPFGPTGTKPSRGPLGDLFSTQGLPQVGPVQNFSPLLTAPPTSLFESPADSAQYANFASLVGTRLRQDPTGQVYKQMLQTVMDSMTSPEAAAKYLRGAGVAEDRLGDLLSGTPAQRDLALKKHRNRLMWALQDAHSSAFGQEP